jgi:riboflavin transporter FmnP
MSRMSRGWTLTKESWRLVRADRTLLWFPVVGAVAGLVVAAVFVGGGIALRSATGSDVLLIVALVLGAYVLAVVATFCNVALAVCVSRALDGQDTTVAEGLAAARGRFDKILGWAGVQLIVGGLSALLQALLREAGGQLVSRTPPGRSPASS